MIFDTRLYMRLTLILSILFHRDMKEHTKPLDELVLDLKKRRRYCLYDTYDSNIHDRHLSEVVVSCIRFAKVELPHYIHFIELNLIEYEWWCNDDVVVSVSHNLDKKTISVMKSKENGKIVEWQKTYDNLCVALRNVSELVVMK